ncbi:MAG: nuclear transport factor 2 family protein, partial [Pseudomonadota bacterium]
MPHKAEILQDWFARVWTDGDLDAILEFLSPDAASKGILPDVALTPDDMPHLVQLMRAQLGPIDVRLAKTMDQGDWIAALLEVRSHVRDTVVAINLFVLIIAR